LSKVEFLEKEEEEIEFRWNPAFDPGMGTNV
jgi:hypothetical protein